MHAIVHAADVQDRDGGALLMASLFGAFEFLIKLYADGGCRGPEFQSAIKRILARVHVEIVKRSGQAPGFVALPKRWIVERTFAWLGRCRRLAKTSLYAEMKTAFRPNAKDENGGRQILVPVGSEQIFAQKLVDAGIILKATHPAYSCGGADTIYIIIDKGSVRGDLFNPTAFSEFFSCECVDIPTRRRQRRIN